MKVEYISIKKIHLNPQNPRLIKDDKFKKLCNSIRDFPRMLELRPIIIDDLGEILAGNQRYRACKELGLKEVPIMRASDLSDEQKQEFIVKDNIGSGEWDFNLLSAQFDSDVLSEWGLDVLGAGDFESITDIGDEKETKEDDYEIPEKDEIKTNIKYGDIIEIGQHRLMCGDSTKIEDVERLMNGKKVDMVFTDPPYGINEKTDRVHEARFGLAKANTFDKILGDENTNTAIKAIEIINYLKVNIQVIWGANYFAHSLSESGNWLVWDKRIEEKQRDVNSDAELAWVKSSKRSVRIFRHLWKGMIKGSENGQRRIHPTQKPIALAEWCFQEYGKDCSNILDLFLGSGSTMVACHQLDRICYGMELEPKYCQVIVDRMKKLDSKLEIKINGQKEKP